MLEELFSQKEGKTLEFKENTRSIQRIVQTVVAFANTAGGTLIVGVKDDPKEIVGLQDVLLEEERIANALADSISPSLLPNFQFHSWRGRDVLMVVVSHGFGPFYVKAKGERDGTYVRLGSTNRIADATFIAEIKNLKNHTALDQLPELRATVDDLDLDLARSLFADVQKVFTLSAAKSMGMMVDDKGDSYPTKGAMLIFGKNREGIFPDPCVRMLRCMGVTKADVLDHAETRSPLPLVINESLAFIRRNTSVGAVIHGVRREDVYQYPPVVVREAVINAILHADYFANRSPIQIAIFDDRLEITNPGSLPFGLSMEAALSGVSQLRNKVLGRVFKELSLIEQWGSGFSRMLAVCRAQNITAPKFEELAGFFRVTLYPRESRVVPSKLWHVSIIDYLRQHEKIAAIDAAKIWNVTRRTATRRLQSMCQEGLLSVVALGSFDPYKVFVLSEPKK